MLPLERRKISELLVLYFLEPELRDIYVEGISDKCVIKRFLESNSSSVNIIEINDIDFSELYIDKPYLKANCKKKIIELSQQLETNFSDSLNGIMCIADRDFDDFLNLIIINSFLNYTDLSSIELYFYNENSLNIFFGNMLHDFPFQSKDVLNQLLPILNKIFNIKLSLLDLFGPEYEVNSFDFKRLVKINKNNGTISFDPYEYINRYVNAHSLIPSQKKIIEEKFKKLSQETSNDLKLKIRGHDFIALFYFFIDKIKNNVNINLETLERVVILCIDLIYIDDFELFKTIKQKYVSI